MIGAGLWNAFWGSWRRASVKLTEPERFRALMGPEHVTQQTAMGLAAAYACVRRKSETCGTFPLHVMKPGARGANFTVRAPEHPLYRILRYRPNPEFTSSRLWVSVFAGLDLWGNAFLEKQRGTARQVVGLGWLHPDLMSDRPNADGSVTYLYRDPVLKRLRELAEDDVVHFRQFSNGHRYGISAIRNGSRSFGSANSIEEAAHATFANGLRPGGYITTGGKVLTDPQREEAKKNLIEDMQGPRNSGKWKLLEGAFDAKPVSISPEDFEMLNSRRWTVEEICRWFDVPPLLIGHSSEGQTMWGTGIEQLFIGWLTLSLRPFVTMVEDQLEMSLLTAPEIVDGVSFKFNFESLLRADTTARATFLVQMVDHGLMTRNEARAKNNDKPMEGGDVLTVQAQMVPLGSVGLAQQRPIAVTTPPAKQGKAAA